ncbi:hypothetical protein IAS59_006759 [Cryptococcus gattii]
MSFIQLVTISAKKECRARILDRESGTNRLEEHHSLAPVLAGIRAEAEEKEPGTRIFDIAVSKDDQNLIFVWEEYASEEAIQGRLHRSRDC